MRKRTTTVSLVRLVLGLTLAAACALCHTGARNDGSHHNGNRVVVSRPAAPPHSRSTAHGPSI
jgi:hypothetical protein